LSPVRRTSRTTAQLLADEAEDEALASAARSEYLSTGLVALRPGRRTRSVLGEQERLLAERQRASVVHLPAGRTAPMSGRLAVTSERLLLVGRAPVTLATLAELDDTCLVSYRLHVALTGGAAFAIRAMRPRLLRVELAEARAQWLDGQASGSEADGSSARGVWPRR
jgi:hypothetical protein